MLNEILCNRAQSIGVTQNDIKMGNRFFAFFNLILVGAFYLALSIIIFYLLHLSLIQCNFCRTSVVNKINRNAILHGFSHRISVDNLAENINCSVNRRAGKTNIGSVRQRIVQILCKSVFTLNTFIGYSHFLIEIYLTAVRFIGNANHICSVGQNI